MMTLGQFATAVGAAPRWVQNAFRVLGLKPGYTEPKARRLAFAKLLKEGCGVPLKRGWKLAPEALAVWPDHKTWTLAGAQGGVALTVDLERFLSTYAVRLSLSRTWYAEKPRGVTRAHPKHGVARARAHGDDISLLRAHLRRTPAARLRMLEEALRFTRRARVVD
jgi:hypothetical protein